MDGAKGAPPPPQRDVTRLITTKLIAIAMDELGKSETQKRINDQVVAPLMKMLHAQLLPYLLFAIGIVIAILLMSMMTLTLSALFYFRRGP